MIAAISVAALVSALVLPHPNLHAAHGAPLTHSLTTTTTPISSPYELAVDPQGNLYVANYGTNNILVYNAGRVQQSARTIATLVNPVGLALDPYGHIFSSNFSSNAVTEYNAAGQLICEMTAGLNQPTNIAVDALDNVYVVNNLYSSLSIFQKSGALAHSYRVGQPFGSMTTAAIVGSTLVTSQDLFATSNQPSLLQEWDAGSLVTGNVASTQDLALYNASFASQIATDASGGEWIADAALKQVIFQQGLQRTSRRVFAQLSYVPQGIAVDSVRALIYVSDTAHNTVDVYNAAAQLVASIQ